MKNTVLALLLGVSFLADAAAEQPAPTLLVPGLPDRPIAPVSLLGPAQQDVRMEESSGDVIIYHGQPLLDTLEKAGLETRTMAGERKVAPAVVLATARDGYTVVFSVGELLMHRRDPRVFLVAETAGGPLPENEGPVRLVVYGDRVRSVYGLARIEMKYLVENRPTQAAPPRKP